MPVVLAKTLTKISVFTYEISLNVNKTDIKIFLVSHKTNHLNVNFRLSGQKIGQKTCTQYLGVLLDEHLLFKDHISTLKQKLNRKNCILDKLRHHLSSDIKKQCTTLFLIQIYFMNVRLGDKENVTDYSWFKELKTEQ